MKFLKRPGRGATSGTPSSKLAERLTDYPPYRMPHPRPAKALSAKEADDNLAAFNEQLPARIDALDGLLTSLGVKPDSYAAVPLLEIPVLSLAECLHPWADASWPEAIAAERRHYDIWQCTNYREADMLYSVAMDTAMLLGDSLRRQVPQLSWTIDRNPENIADGMPTVNRIVLTVSKPVSAERSASSQALPVVNTLIDWESAVASVAYEPARDRFRLLNDWKLLAERAIASG